MHGRTWSSRSGWRFDPSLARTRPRASRRSSARSPTGTRRSSSPSSAAITRTREFASGSAIPGRSPRPSTRGSTRSTSRRASPTRSSRAGRSGGTRRPAAGPSRVEGRARHGSRENDMVATAPLTWLDPFLATWRPGTGAPREIREPATDRPLITVPEATADDVARAAATAAAAQPAWAEASYIERARILRRAAEIYEAHREEFGTWTQRETGAVHGKMHHEQNFTVQELLNASTMPSQAYGSLMPSAMPGRLSMVRRVPIGVIGAITPWNSPSVLGMRVVAPALALGNAVVLKPDPQTPVAGGAMFAAVFAEAGLPDGLLQIVIGDAETGQALVTDPNIDLVSFTGSTEVGRLV